MTKRKAVKIKGKTFKRVGTEYSWARARSRARQERKHYNVKVVVRKDKTGNGYGIFERNI